MGSFVGAGAVSSNSALAPSTNMSVAVHASTVDDDTLLLIVHKNDNNGDVSTPVGWTKETTLSYITSAGDDRTIAVFTRPASSEPSSYNIQHTDSTAEEVSAVILTYRGFTSAIFDVTPTSAHVAEDTNDFTPNPIPTIITVTDGAWVITAAILTLGTMTSGGAPTGYNDRVSHLNTNRNLLIADKEIATAGSEDPVSWNSSGSGASPDSTMITFALEPSAAAEIAQLPQGTFTLTGFDFEAEIPWIAQAPQGAFSLAGFDLSALVSDIANIPQGTFLLTGFDFTANNADPQVGQVPAGTFLLTGFDLAALTTDIADIPQGQFTLNGFDFEAEVPWIGQVPAGAFVLTGFDFNAVVPDGEVAQVPQGQFTLTGFDFQAEIPSAGQVPTGIFSLVGLDFTAQVSSAVAGGDPDIVRWRRRGRR